jgi:hypothetical protein
VLATCAAFSIRFDCTRIAVDKTKTGEIDANKMAMTTIPMRDSIIVKPELSVDGLF